LLRLAHHGKAGDYHATSIIERFGGYIIPTKAIIFKEKMGFEEPICLFLFLKYFKGIGSDFKSY
jgi:hypothetical protein